MKVTAALLLGLALISCFIFTGCGKSSNSGGPLAIDAAPLPLGTVGTPYSYAVPASGGTPPYVWSLISGTLPAGLKLGSKGVISGTPQSVQTTSFTLAISDSGAVPASATSNFSLTIQTELAVASLSVPVGTVGVSYNASLAATGGAPPYTWTVLNGSLPPGLNLSSGGTISGAPSASGSFLFTVQVVDSESPAQTAVGQLSIVVNIVSITTQSLPAGTVNVQYSTQLAAIGGVKPYTWTVSGTLPSGLALSSAGVIRGTPTALGSTNFTVQVADSEQQPAIATTQLNLTINGVSSSTPLAGNYAFYLNGFNPGGAWTLVGSFVADGTGNITSGVVDFNSATAQPVNAAPITGTYTAANSGLNTLTIQGAAWGPITLAFVLDSTGNGRVIEYDDRTGRGSRGSGALRRADPSAFVLNGLNGAWAFGMTGSNPMRYVNVGQFTLASGSILNGSSDVNDGGNYQTFTFNGTLSAVDPQTGRATATLQSQSGASDEAIYVVSRTELVMEQIGPILQNGTPLLLGSVLQQTGPFSNSSLNGAAILYMQDIFDPGGPDQSIAGLFSFDGTGNINIIAMDEDLAGAITQDQPSQGTYSVGSNGAMTMNCFNCPAGFLVSLNRGFFVGANIASIFGILEPQTGGPFSDALLSASYAAGSLPALDYANGENEVALGSADGVGTLTVSGDSSDASGLKQSSGTIISYNIAANGRGTLQSQSDQAASVVYMISPTRWITLQPNQQASVEVFQH